MSREIRFRAWRYEDKRMEPVCVLDGKPGHYDHVGREGSLYVDGVVSPPMQFTGLRDRNGRGIFEGDIVLVDLNGPDNDPVLRPVEYQFNGYYIPVTNGDYEAISSPRLTLEIRGNIYADPDLLND